MGGIIQRDLKEELMRLNLALPVVIVSLRTFIPAALASSAEDEGRALAHRSLEAMGGEQHFKDLHTLRLQAIGHRYMLEQSERPDGPWLLDYFQISEERDLDHSRIRRESNSRGCDSTECWKSPEWTTSTLIVADGTAALVKDGKVSAGRASVVQPAEETVLMAPDRALLLALEARDLRALADISFHGFAHHVLSFTAYGAAMKILLSADTNLPSAVEMTRTRPYEVYWSPWGDVTTRVMFAFWMLEPGGLHYPREFSYETNGQPDWVLMVNQLNLNPSIKAEDFAIPDEVKNTFVERKAAIEDWPLGSTSDPARELAPGVVLLPGRWNILEIRQSDGIVILEAPISNKYSAMVMEDAKKRFPGLPVKCVVTTSDAWPHIGGVREYVANGIPIYALDLNRGILERLLRAPHSIKPDALQLHPRSPKITYVAKRTRLGSDSNAIDIIPMRTVTSERQLVVYLPAHKLLYSSDAFQRDANGDFFLPQTVSEVVSVVGREKLDVDTDVGMHLGPTPWQSIEKSLSSLRVQRKQ